MTAVQPAAGTATIWRLQRWHWILLAAGLLLRFAACVMVNRGDPFGGWDGREYHAFAQHLFRFAGDDYPRFFNFVRAPGYPLFLLPFVAFNTTAVWHIQLVQCFLGVFQAVLLAGIAARWAGARCANIMFVLCALNPFLIYYCGFVLTETVFITLLWLGIAALQRLLPADADWARWLTWAGVAFGLACLVRPALQPFLVVAVCWLGWVALKNGGWLVALRRMAHFTAVVSALLLPWQLGNAWAHGSFTLGPGYAEAVYLQSNSLEFVQMYEAKSADEYYRAFTKSVYHLSRESGASPDTWMDEAAAFRRDHPAEWRRLQWHKFTHFWRPWLNPLIFPRSQVLLSIVFTTPLFLIAALEIWKRFRTSDAFFALLLSLVLTGYVIGGLLFVASVRYRIPLVDVTFLFFAASWLERFALPRSRT
ncbi:MAG: hypothetical protein AB1705_03610 [Verrucomicrobiota bacterium]